METIPAFNSQKSDYEPIIKFVAAVVISFLIAVVGIPFAVFIGTVFSLVRLILTLVKRILHPTYGQFLCGLASVFGSEDPYGPETETSIVSYNLVDGQVDVERFRERAELKLKDFAQQGIYPELKCRLSTWAGFSVWVPAEDFSIENHVKHLSQKDLLKLGGVTELNDENISTVARLILSLPYKEGTPLWEIYICNNASSHTASPGSAPSFAIFRFHHSMVDGLSALKVMYEFYETDNDGSDTTQMMEQGQIKQEGGSFPRRLLHAITVPFLAVWDLGKLIAYCTDFNGWHTPWSPHRTDHQYSHMLFPVEKVKRIRENRGTTFSGAICAVQAGALRKFMDWRGEPIPENMHAVVSLPIPGKQRVLSNDITFVVLQYPVGQNDRREVVRNVEDVITRTKVAQYPMLVMFAVKVVGLFPKRLMSSIYRWIFTTCLTTNFPAARSTIRFSGYPMKYGGAVANLPSNVGMYVWCIGYDGTVSLSIGFSSGIVKDKKEASKYLDFVREELESFQNVEDNEILRPLPTNFRYQTMTQKDN